MTGARRAVVVACVSLASGASPIRRSASINVGGTAAHYAADVADVPSTQKHGLELVEISSDGVASEADVGIGSSDDAKETGASSQEAPFSCGGLSRIEIHAPGSNFSDVCRSIAHNGPWTCPFGCQFTAYKNAPYCFLTRTGDECHHQAPFSCAGGKLEKHEPGTNHADVCRKEIQLVGGHVAKFWDCPVGCQYTLGSNAPYCLRTGTDDECHHQTATTTTTTTVNVKIYGAWKYYGSFRGFTIKTGTQSMSGTMKMEDYAYNVGASVSATSTSSVTASIGPPTASVSASTELSIAAEASYDQTWGTQFTSTFSQSNSKGIETKCEWHDHNHPYTWVWTIFGEIDGNKFETVGVPSFDCAYTKNKGEKPLCMPGWCEDKYKGCQDCATDTTTGAKKWLDPSKHRFGRNHGSQAATPAPTPAPTPTPTQEQRMKVSFTNEYGNSVQLYWIPPGETIIREDSATVRDPWLMSDVAWVNTYVGHSFAARDTASGEVLKIFTIDGNTHEYILGSAEASALPSKLVYPNTDCGILRPLSEAQCRTVPGYTFTSTLNADSNWIDGCFEWYSKVGGMNDNTKKLYYNKRAGATTGKYGGNRMCGQAATIVCGSSNFCVGWESVNVYCYGFSDGCKWDSNDCQTDADCSKYSTGSLKYTDGDSPSCPASGWRADAPCSQAGR